MRLLTAFGFSFESYEELQEWMSDGILSNKDKINKLYQREISINEVFARFHGKIVEYCKENSKGKNVFIESLKL